ncbi:DUF1499 domain-containing protein [Oryzibacter oryziterrae]|uniref:DUF1499 domain-containing protein n=1 Tax=Oryzibacter oryziterrae TaxID=2766474 RepID=UPI001F248867|nr:DUF1499 domain-containing protein [Oryzibacter oryziterrae]
MAALALVLLLLVGAFSFYGREESWALLFGPADLGPYDFAAPVRTGKLNDMLACPDGACAKGEPGIITPHYAAPAAAVFDIASKAVRKLPGKVAVIGINPINTRLRAVVYSPNIRIPSTLSVMVQPTSDGGSDIFLYSRSQIGYYDMGRNAADIEALLSAIEAELKAPPKP